MALPAIVSHQGAISASPSQGSVAAPSLQELMNTSWQGTYGARFSAAPTIINATDGAPFVLPLQTITKVRVIAIRAVSGTIRIKLTSAYGTDQVIPCSSFFMIHVPFAGDEFTAVKLVGTADVEYVVAGDVS